jgi:hypothetical protein
MVLLALFAIARLSTAQQHTCTCKTMEVCATVNADPDVFVCSADQVVSSMSSLSTNTGVQVNGCFALFEQAEMNYDSLCLVRTAGGHRAAKAALAAFPKDTSVQMFCGRLVEITLADKFHPGDMVTWIGADNDVPAGAVGEVLVAASDSSQVRVQFPNGVWNFDTAELRRYGGDQSAAEAMLYSSEGDEAGPDLLEALNMFVFVVCPMLVILLTACSKRRQQTAPVAGTGLRAPGNRGLNQVLLEHLYNATCVLVPSSSDPGLTPSEPHGLGLSSDPGLTATFSNPMAQQLEQPTSTATEDEAYMCQPCALNQTPASQLTIVEIAEEPTGEA